MHIKLKVIMISFIGLLSLFLTACKAQSEKTAESSDVTKETVITEAVTSETTTETVSTETTTEIVTTETTLHKDEIMEVETITDPKQKLEAKQEDQKTIYEMMSQLYRATAYVALGHVFSLKDVQNYISVTQIREFIEEYSDYEENYYSIHDCKEGGRLFVFYGLPYTGSPDENYPYDYKTYAAMFMGENLNVQDFDGLKLNVSTMEDVEKIDSATRFNFFNRDAGDAMNWYVWEFRVGDMDKYYSAHLIRDGYIVINYKKEGENFVVAEITQREDSRIAAIEQVDYELR